MNGRCEKGIELLKLSLLNVFSMPVRSCLTVLGFAIGVAAVLAVLTLGKAGKEKVESEMGRLGIDKVWISAANGQPMVQGMGTWLEEKTGFDAEELIYLPVRIENNENYGCDACLVGCEWPYVCNYAVSPPINGRIDWLTQDRIVWLGKAAASSLSVQTGEQIAIEGMLFRIGGIVQNTDNYSTISIDDAVMMPLRTALLFSGDIIHEIQVNSQNILSVEKAQRLTEQLMRTQGINARVMSMKVQMDAAQSVIATFINVLKWVAMICMVVGGTGIMNILLISIRERRREIGVMKAMGTDYIQICILFMLEALAYAAVGGGAGIGLGWLLIHVAGKSIELSATASTVDCTMIFVFSMIAGVIFGVWPAFRAARMSCIDALRQE